jgi:hypothetical protein
MQRYRHGWYCNLYSTYSQSLPLIGQEKSVQGPVATATPDAIAAFYRN